MKQFRDNEEGFILITVLLVIALLFPLVLAFNSKVQLNLLQAGNFRNSIQAVRMARAGVEGAVGILKYDDPGYDSRRDTWGMLFPPLAAGDGILTVNIVDEDGKIPVNKLIGTEGGNDVDKEVNLRLRALIANLGGKPEIVDALIDWIDADDEVTGSEGAEEEYYKDHGYHCKNGPLDSIEEILMVRGFDRELLMEGKLGEYLTVAQMKDKGIRVNVNTAPMAVLHAVLGTKTDSYPTPLSESEIEDIGHYREEHELRTMNDIDGVVKLSQTQSRGNIKNLLKVSSSYFTVTSKYAIDKVVKQVEALLVRNDNNVTIKSWREF